MPAKAEQVQRLGANPDAVSLEEMKALLRRRQGRAEQPVYRVVPDAATLEQVAALPVEALSAYAEVLVVLESQPWNGRPQHEALPGAAVRY
jgi:hypothetical protein